MAGGGPFEPLSDEVVPGSATLWAGSLFGCHAPAAFVKRGRQPAQYLSAQFVDAIGRRHLVFAELGVGLLRRALRFHVMSGGSGKHLVSTPRRAGRSAAEPQPKLEFKLQLASEGVSTWSNKLKLELQRRHASPENKHSDALHDRGELVFDLCA